MRPSAPVPLHPIDCEYDFGNDPLGGKRQAWFSLAVGSGRARSGSGRAADEEEQRGKDGARKPAANINHLAGRMNGPGARLRSTRSALATPLMTAIISGSDAANNGGRRIAATAILARLTPRSNSDVCRQARPISADWRGVVRYRPAWDRPVPAGHHRLPRRRV
jgi:hypothetical protein